MKKVRNSEVQRLIAYGTVSLYPLDEEAEDAATVFADNAGHIVFLSPAAEALWGWSVAEVAGQPLTVLMPERFRAAHQRGLEAVTVEGFERSRVLFKTLALPALRRDGAEIPVLVTTVVWTSAEGRTFFVADVRPDPSGEATT